MRDCSLSIFGEDVKSIGFFGLGRTSSALLGLSEVRRREIVLRSDFPIDRAMIPKGLEAVKIYDGKDACRDIHEDLLLLSPSVRRDRAQFRSALKRGTVLSSDAEIFFERVKRPVFAVTGSDGKSTTTALIGELLKERFPTVQVCGNIGEPMLTHLYDSEAYAVELSSFQLTYSAPRPLRAAVTNVSENHLNWHRDFEEYTEAKLSLLHNAKEAVLNADDPILRARVGEKNVYAVTSAERCFSELSKEYPAHCYYTAEDGYICKNGVRLLSISEVRRSEAHNIKNLLLALATCDGYASEDTAYKVATSFAGLAHRCEIVLLRDGIEFINSSIDTTPARTAATLASLGRQVIIILGGRGKGLSPQPILPMLKKYAKLAVITGECREEFLSAVNGVTKVESASDFASAVRLAIAAASIGDTVLLSPAATSYDEFENFEARGNLFKQIVLEHYEKC